MFLHKQLAQYLNVPLKDIKQAEEWYQCLFAIVKGKRGRFFPKKYLEPFPFKRGDIVASNNCSYEVIEAMGTLVYCRSFYFSGAGYFKGVREHQFNSYDLRIATDSYHIAHVESGIKAHERQTRKPRKKPGVAVRIKLEGKRKELEGILLSATRDKDTLELPVKLLNGRVQYFDILEVHPAYTVTQELAKLQQEVYHLLETKTAALIGTDETVEVLQPYPNVHGKYWCKRFGEVEEYFPQEIALLSPA